MMLFNYVTTPLPPPSPPPRVAVVVSSANMELALVRQCVDRALVLDDRVSKFSVQLGEWPGDMAKLLDFLSREDVR